MHPVLVVAALILCTALSAFFDAKGFVYAARAWENGRMLPWVALLSLLYFIGGVTLYIVSIGFQQRIGVQSAAIQSIFWFAMTVVGIAIMDGTITHWSMTQLAVGIAVTVGIGWLLVNAPH